MKMQKGNFETFPVKKMITNVLVEDYIQNCVDIERFLQFCRECSNYGKIWSCPPFTFHPMDYWRKYRTFSIHAYKILVPDELREKQYEKEETYGILESIMSDVKKQFDQDMLSIEGDGLALSGGTCLNCPLGTCSRITGEPCRHPEKMRHSIESLGGDVTKTVEAYFGEKMLWMKDGILPEYFILVGGILEK